MKLGKKTTALCAVVAGAVIFTTSALADVMIGSGYNSLKDAVKRTSRVLTTEADNYTVDVSAKITADGGEVMNMTQCAKVDLSGNRSENSGIVSSKNAGTRETYTYLDSDKDIYLTEEGSYTVYERREGETFGVAREDIFEEEMVQDAEKVMDAFVGNLKDLVQTDENDGKTMYIGNVSDAQIPVVANAALSFVLKYSVFDENTAKEYGLPELKNDIYVKTVSGKAVENEEGLLENAVVTGTLVGKDENGNEHSLACELTYALRDIHTTAVTEPDLNGKEVNYVTRQETEKVGMLAQKYVGRYKIDIIDTVDDAFVKIGERDFEITSIDGQTFTALYAERYQDGYAPETVRVYAAQGHWDENLYEYVLEYTDENGETAYGVLNTRQGDLCIYFGIEITEDGTGFTTKHDTNFRSNTFIRVFD